MAQVQESRSPPNDARMIASFEKGKVASSIQSQLRDYPPIAPVDPFFPVFRIS